MEVFNLDIIPGKSAPVIHASQFDAGREFKANLFEGPTVYTLSGAETLSVIVRKPDGNMVTAAVTNTSDSYITFETTEQMTACDGANLCELRIENGADVIGSINFIMEVEKSPDTGITSASEIHNLEAQVDAFTAIAVADQYDSANVIFDNSPTPGHGNGYAVTSEGVLNAIPANSDFSLSGLSDTTITTPSSGQVLSYDGWKWKNKSTARTDITSQVTFNETITGTFTEFFVKNDVLYIYYQGQNKAHAAQDLIFTLPAGFRPSMLKYIPFLSVYGTYYLMGTVSLNTDGTCKINQINDTTNTGRIYFCVAYPIA